jgi:hypothetical protein
MEMVIISLEMNEKNTYLVKAYPKAFHKVELGREIGGCKIDYDYDQNRYFISTVVVGNTPEEAQEKGFLRVSQVLSVFCVHTGVSYKIDSIHIEQISGKKPFLYTAPMTLVWESYLPIDDRKIREIEETFTVLDKLSNEKRSTKIVTKAINYFLRGCYLETKWRSESFLNFYKVIELIAQDFQESYNQTLENQLKNTLLEDIAKEEIKQLRTSKRLIQFMCLQLGITSNNDISQIVELRPKFSAHATLQEVDVSPEEFNKCKALAGKAIINYIYHLQPSL